MNYLVLTSHVFNGGIHKEAGEQVDLDEQTAAVLKSHKIIGDLPKEPDPVIETAEAAPKLEKVAIDLKPKKITPPKKKTVKKKGK